MLAGEGHLVHSHTTEPDLRGESGQQERIHVEEVGPLVPEALTSVGRCRGPTSSILVDQKPIMCTNLRPNELLRCSQA